MWTPSSNLHIPDFNIAAKKLRASRGGGVAILTKKNVKSVALTEFDTQGLEAVWIDAMVGDERAVVGSVYINVGKIDEIDKLEAVIGKILGKHKSLIICMDANSRHAMWDSFCSALPRSSTVRKMGEKLQSIIINHSLQLHNNHGEITYRSGNSKSSIDITLSTGLNTHTHHGRQQMT